MDTKTALTNILTAMDAIPTATVEAAMERVELTGQEYADSLAHVERIIDRVEDIDAALAEASTV